LYLQFVSVFVVSGCSAFAKADILKINLPLIMDLQLNRPICFFDLETTGTNISKDRIVEISIHKVFPNGEEKTYTFKVNPTVPIPAETTAIHGITDDMVKDEPTFKERAHEVNNIIKDADLAGFNSNRFDIPLLAEEMLRAGIDFEMGNRNAIDVQNIFHKMEQRTLVAAYKFYCQKDLTDAHSAEADTIATYEVLKGQLDRYPELDNNMKSLAEFSTRRKPVDFAGMLAFNDAGEECFNFGKHKGKRIVDVLEQEPGYYSWIQNADFPLYTKKVLTAIKLRGFNG
jgi:DNA polymerase-3 subunit epsilon